MVMRFLPWQSDYHGNEITMVMITMVVYIYMVMSDKISAYPNFGLCFDATVYHANLAT